MPRTYFADAGTPHMGRPIVRVITHIGTRRETTPHAAPPADALTFVLPFVLALLAWRIGR